MTTRKILSVILAVSLALMLPGMTFADITPDNPDTADIVETQDADTPGPGSGPTLGMSGVITAFAPLAPDIAAQTVQFGTAREALVLPETLEVTTEGKTEPVFIAVTWEDEPEYEPEYEPATAGSYVFTAELPDGYTAVPLSVSTVKVGDYVYFSKYNSKDICLAVFRQRNSSP